MDEHVQPQLSPPWITYFNELRNSIGADPTVTVGPLIPTDGNFIILVQTTDIEKAIALATHRHQAKSTNYPKIRDFKNYIIIDYYANTSSRRRTWYIIIE